MSAQQELNQRLAEWNSLTHQYREQAPKAARAEAEYRSTRAREIRTLIISENTPVSKAEYIADGSPDVEEKLMSRFVEQAAIDAMRQRLKWLEADAERLRTLVVTERAQDKLHGTYGEG
ncbi:hypothetical protein SEA_VALENTINIPUFF_99 [Microbacterium phage ValentiniPuff]|uniref:Uncharacterized protein n=1 Tax=Microbacterium phage ValentiniPuff TaxID=2315705 RepID=A0A386KS12_9CAUD|nr:hypothetical protein SEA_VALENTINIPUFF_99 [Microbacterium phage ValentiniPuff]